MTRDEAIDILKNIWHVATKDAPIEKALEIAIEALEEPQKQTGKWIDGQCSCCGCDAPAYIIDWKWQKDMDAKFCPNCGAMMKEGDVDDMG